MQRDQNGHADRGGDADGGTRRRHRTEAGHALQRVHHDSVDADLDGALVVRLGEAQEKLKDSKSAKEAYSKYIALAPEAKNAAEIRKKLARLK